MIAFLSMGGFVGECFWMKGFILLLCSVSLAFGGAQLVWNANPASDGVAKYVAYHSTNVAAIDVTPWWLTFDPIGDTTNTFFDLGRLRSGQHFFIVTAVSTNGFESDPSNNVLAPVPNPAQGLRIVIVIP